MEPAQHTGNNAGKNESAWSFLPGIKCKISVMLLKQIKESSLRFLDFIAHIITYAVWGVSI